MRRGIPYFGLENNEVYEKILSSESRTVEYNSLYEVLSEFIESNTVIVIDNCYLTYFRDIQLNYRDRFASIPYYSYETQITESKAIGKGHLIKDEDGTVWLRHSYRLESKKLDLENNVIVVYNLDTEEKLEVTFKTWFDGSEFSMDKLYDMYVQSCYKEDDYTFVKHTGGYHLIDESSERFINYERKMRQKRQLKDYSGAVKNVEKYRDVREYSSGSIIKSIGIQAIHYENLYKRRFRFEAYLFCLMRAEAKPNDYSLSDWNKLGKSERYIKIGTDIVLIIKYYWKSEFKDFKKKSWSRI